MRCKRVFSIKMATFYGEVLPVFSRAVDDEEDEDEDISEQWCGNFISSAVIWFIILHRLDVFIYTLSRYKICFYRRPSAKTSSVTCSWVVLRNCVPLGVGNFKLVFEGNRLLQCKYFYFLSLYVDVSDNKNNNDCQSCVLCTLNRTDVAK